jgi:predicted dehydrogenase
VPGLDAVAVCTPPGVRHRVARDALEAGKHVLLEKPPAATLGEVADLERRAAAAGRVLFAAWHSRFNPAVEAARARLADHAVRRLAVTWKEDVRRWHPGQRWIWEPGGFGVFDPGINALSILTRVLPGPLFVKRAELLFPANREAPIAATLAFHDGSGEAELGFAEFDWRQAGAQSWDILVETGAGTALRLSEGGRRLEVDGRAVDTQGRRDRRIRAGLPRVRPPAARRAFRGGRGAAAARRRRVPGRPPARGGALRRLTPAASRAGRPPRSAPRVPSGAASDHPLEPPHEVAVQLLAALVEPVPASRVEDELLRLAARS